MALGVGLCNNGFMHHGNPASAQPSSPRGGWGGLRPETELPGRDPWSLVHCPSQGKQAQRQQVAGWQLPSKAVGVGLWTAVALGQLMHSPPPPPPVLHQWRDHFRCPVGTEVAIKSMGFPSRYSPDGRRPPRVGSEVGKVGLVHWASWEGGGEGSMGTEDRAVSVRGGRQGLALRHVPPSPAGQAVPRGGGWMV